MYLSKGKHWKKKVSPFGFDIGDYVRLSDLKQPFRKSLVYNITGWDKSPLKGQFYKAELTKVDSSAENQFFFIEKVFEQEKSERETTISSKMGGISHQYE